MDAIQAMLLKLKQTYIAELPDRLDLMEEQVLALEKFGSTEERYNELFRQVHSLKGSGGTHGLHIITSICHPLEDYLSTIPDRGDLSSFGFANIALSYIDLLRDVALRLKQKTESFHDIEGELSELRQRSFAPRYTALLVENSSVVINILKRILHHFNFRVVVQDDGYSTLGRALVEPCDLLITALEVKLLNGMALIAALKLAHGMNCHAKSILLTANPALIIPANRPDYVITKDDQLSSNVTAAIKAVVAHLELVTRT